MSKWSDYIDGKLTLGNVTKWSFRPIVLSGVAVCLLLVGVSNTLAQDDANVESSAKDSENAVEAVLQEAATCPAEAATCPMKAAATCPAETAACPMEAACAMQNGRYCPMAKVLTADGIGHCCVCGCHCLKPADDSMSCCDSPVCRTLCAMRKISGPRAKERFRDACADVVARIPKRGMMEKFAPMTKFDAPLPDGREMLSENEALSGNRATILSENTAFSGNHLCAKKSMNALFGVNVMVVLNFDPGTMATTQSGNIEEEVETEEETE